jgi:hypothetical protein
MQQICDLLHVRLLHQQLIEAKF